MTGAQRSSRRRAATMREDRLAQAEARVDAGATDHRLIKFVNNKGRLKHVDGKAAAALVTKDANSRTSVDRLSFNLRHATGCIVPGCPLSAVCMDPPMICLLEYDHRDKATKFASISQLRGAARAEELQKTDPRCLWHHFIHTREQNRHTPAFNRQNKATRELALRKERTGCQHPEHSSMPYASLVPTAQIDPLVSGFLDVSHVKLGEVKIGALNSSSTKLAHLDSGDAVIHCKFCHRLYTNLERSKLFDTATSQHHAKVIRQVSPAFVQHFEERTADLNWEALRLRVGSKISRGRLGTKNGSGKKKRKLPISVVDSVDEAEHKKAKNESPADASVMDIDWCHVASLVTRVGFRF